MNNTNQIFRRFCDNIESYKTQGKKLFCSSSFQSYSLPLLHMISKIDNSIPVYFINTGFHFPETLVFKRQVSKLLNLNVIEIESDVPKINQLDQDGIFHYIRDPAYCCLLNKVIPLKNVFHEYDVWINGIRKDQNSNRSKMKEKLVTNEGIERYHPVLEFTAKMIWNYIKEYNLPRHPLEAKGYLSVGCEPCTSQFFSGDLDSLRKGSRWEGLNKTECGLHTDLAK